MHTVTAIHKGTDQIIDRDKVIIGNNVQVVNHQMATHQTTIPYPDQADTPRAER